MNTVLVISSVILAGVFFWLGFTAHKLVQRITDRANRLKLK